MTELFNPHSGEWLLNKFETYKELRDRQTAYWSEKYQMYVITRYDDVVFALSNPEIFSSAKGNLIVEEELRFGNTLGASDNPSHDEFKDIVKEAYSKKNIERIINVVKEKSKQLLSDHNNINISDISEQISAWVITEVLNVPYDKERMKDYILDIQHNSKLAVLNGDDSKGGMERFNALIILLVSVKRPATGPGIYDCFLNNNPLGITEMSLFKGPTLSGGSSMSSALQFLMLDLYRTGALDSVINDRSLIPNAVTESLRYHASTGRFSRTVMTETILHGVTLKPGDRVALCLDAANRDPRAFEMPDVFDLHRSGQKHMAFGHGLHACIALAVSKSVMTMFLEVFLDVFGRYTVLTKDSELDYVMTASGNNDMISNIIITRT